MRCLIIAPYDTNLDGLREVLAEQEVVPESSGDFAAGTLLASAPLEQFDFAVAVIPGEITGSTGLSAIAVEIGVVVGRGLPVILIVEPPGSVPPVLAGLPVIAAKADNTDALRFHLRLFAATLSGERSRTPKWPPPPSTTLSTADLSDLRAQLGKLREMEVSKRGYAFERFVVTLLKKASALIEEPKTRPDGGVDAVAVLPGEEQRLGTLLIQLKTGPISPGRLTDMEAQLQQYVIERRGGLGVLIYDGPQLKTPRPPTPLVLTLGVEELLDALATRPLSRVLVEARNAAIHRM
jgi:hypothetical protein